jgi:hypothetical protein
VKRTPAQILAAFNDGDHDWSSGDELDMAEAFSELLLAATAARNSLRSFSNPYDTRWDKSDQKALEALEIALGEE